MSNPGHRNLPLKLVAMAITEFYNQNNMASGGRPTYFFTARDWSTKLCKTFKPQRKNAPLKLQPIHPNKCFV